MAAKERIRKARAVKHDDSDQQRTAKSVTEAGSPSVSSVSGQFGSDIRPVDHERRRAEIALAAYYRAERRGFGGAGEVDDWLEAEREFDSRAEQAALLQRSALLPRMGGTDRDRDLIETDRLAAWAKKLKVSTPRLREAIERVGPSVSGVKQYLESVPGTASQIERPR